MLSNLNLIVLRCRDIDCARHFYECLEMTFQSERHGKGPLHYSSADAAGVLELYPAKDGSPDQTGLGFYTDDLESLQTELRNVKYSPTEISSTPHGRSFVVRDPDGRRVELKARP